MSGGAGGGTFASSSDSKYGGASYDDVSASDTSAGTDSTSADGSETTRSVASVRVTECATVKAVTIFSTSMKAPRKLSAACHCPLRRTTTAGSNAGAEHGDEHQQDARPRRVQGQAEEQQDPEGHGDEEPWHRLHAQQIPVIAITGRPAKDWPRSPVAAAPSQAI